MNRKRAAILIAPIALVAAGCVESVPPKSLVNNARVHDAHAKDGIALQLAPAYVHETDTALRSSEQDSSSAPSDWNGDLAVLGDFTGAARDAQRYQADLDATHAGDANCSSSADDTACDICIGQSCCPEIEACDADAGCVATAKQILTSCGEAFSFACLRQIVQASGNVAAENLVSCTKDKCASPCAD